MKLRPTPGMQTRNLGLLGAIVSTVTLVVLGILIGPNTSAAGLHQPDSPLPQGSHKDEDESVVEKLHWIMPEGGLFQSDNCSGVQVTFPPDFYYRRVNAHCNLTQVPIKDKLGWTDSGLRFFFGVWSGGGEVVEFDRPISFFIPIAQEDDPSLLPGNAKRTALCIWNEMNRDWQCVDARISADRKYLLATLEQLLPTREIEGWDGNSLAAVFWTGSQNTVAVPTSIPTPVEPPGMEDSSTLVYRNDFEAEIGTEWTKARTAVTPSGRRFLGQFGAEKVRLALDGDLPDHTRVKLAFNLYVIGTWDGNRGDGLGPDRWKIQVRDGPLLLYTSFGNGNPTISQYTQSYPGWYPDDDYPKRSGTIENNTLGYPDVAGRLLIQDAVYHLEFEFDHKLPEIIVEFEGVGLQPVDDESWGIDDIVISVLGG